MPHIEQGDLPGARSREHPPPADRPASLVVMRRLLSLDFVLEHPGMNWLHSEPEKVEFFEEIGLPRRLIPRRVYYGVARQPEALLCAQTTPCRGPLNRHLCLRQSGPPDGYRTPLVGSRAWAALGCAPQEGAAGSGDRNCG